MLRVNADSDTQKLPVLIALLAVAYLSAGCGPTPTRAPLPTRIPTPNPTPIPVVIDEAASHAGDRVVVEGYLSSSINISCSFDGEFCWLHFSPTEESDAVALLGLDAERTSVPNTMYPLPSGRFESSDIIVRGDDMQVAKAGDHIRVTGWVILSDRELSGMPEGSPIIRVETIGLLP